MTVQSWSAYIFVPLFGVFIWAVPTVSRPTLKFGVRVPSHRAALTTPMFHRCCHGDTDVPSMSLDPVFGGSWSGRRARGDRGTGAHVSKPSTN